MTSRDENVRVALCARVSTDMQAEEGKSIPAQLAEMQEFAAARGWTVASEFVDPGFSGSNMERPDLQALLAAAEEGAYDVLLVHELSRLSRSIYDTLHIFEYLGEMDIGFASVKEPDFDFSTPTGRLFLTILAALNQYYVDLLRMHVAKSKRQRAREGLYNASTLPHGYRHSGDSETPPVIVGQEAQVVLKMFRRYARGKYSYTELAQWINDAGHRTRSGRRFSKDTVADMIRNPFYKGCIVYRRGSRDQEEGELFPGKHEAIVSAELWDECERVRRKRKGAPRTFQPKYRVYLLNGIVTCDVCGRKLRAQGSGAHLYYREMSAQRGFVDCPSVHKGVRTEVVDGQVGAIFRRLRLPEDWQGRLTNLVEDDSADQRTLERRRKRLIAERRRVKRMRIQGEFDDDPELYREEVSRIKRQLAELPARADLGAIERAATVLEELAEVWDEASLVDRRDLLRIAIREVKVDVPQGRVATIEPYPLFVPLFRQVELVDEVSFGVFAPRWPPELAEEIDSLAVLAPSLEVPVFEKAPDWPLVPALPAEIVGQRITPTVSAWLKERRAAGEALGPVVDLARRGVSALRVDARKWPGVSVERVSSLADVQDGAAVFLWTPFALQRCEDREAAIEEALRALAPGGVWAFVDVMPASMPGHWLYRFFPGAWDDEVKRAWDTSRMYNELMRGGSCRVGLERRSFYRARGLGAVRQVARERDRSPHLARLPDEAYAAGLEALEELLRREGEEGVVGSEFCLVEVEVTRDGD